MRGSACGCSDGRCYCRPAEGAVAGSREVNWLQCRDNGAESLAAVAPQAAAAAALVGTEGTAPSPGVHRAAATSRISTGNAASPQKHR